MTLEILLNTIEMRRSNGGLNAPAPSDSQLHQVFRAALTAPEHKQLKPWQFVVLRAQGQQKLADFFTQALIAQGEQNPIVLERAQKQPFRAPLIITCILRYVEHEKVTLQEQRLSIGAAIENMLLVLTAQGFGSIWRTGPFINTPEVRAGFDLKEHDEICGFIYVATADKTLPPREPIQTADFVNDWH